MKLEEKLIRLRRDNGLSQLKIAEELGVSRQAVSRWEVGAALPSTENLKRLAELYKVSIDELLMECSELDSEAEKQAVTEQRGESRSETEIVIRPKPQNLRCIITVMLILLGVAGGYILGYWHTKSDQSRNKPIPMSQLDQEYWDLDEVPEFTYGWPALVE